MFLDAIAAAGGTETLRDVRMDLTGAEADALKAVLAWRANCPPGAIRASMPWPSA